MIECLKDLGYEADLKNLDSDRNDICEYIKITTDEDLEIHLKVRRVIRADQAYFAKDVIVYGSIRKVKAFGYAGILLWYWERRYKPKIIDVR